MSGNIEVGEIHIGTVNIREGGFSPAIDEMLRGVMPEELRDQGQEVSEAEIDSAAEIAEPETPIEEQEDRLEALEKQSEQDRINASARQTYLTQMVQDSGRQRRREGFIRHHDPDHQPEDRTDAEEKHHEAVKNAEETLKRACDVCIHAGNCALKGNYPLWNATHPYAKSDRKLTYHYELYPQIKVVESRMKFLKRLSKDPQAHCIPPKKK